MLERHRAGWCVRGRRVAVLLRAVAGVALASMFSSSALAGSIDLVAQFAPIGSANYPYADIWAEGDYAYLGTWLGGGVYIIDISDPENPSLVSTYNPTQDYMLDIKVFDQVGYFSTDSIPSDGLHIVDLSNPASPTLLAKIKAAQGGFNWVHNSSKAGDYLYLVGWEDSISVFDVSSPASPIFVRSIVTPDNGVIHDVTATGARLYAADIENGFTYIYDTSAIGVSAAVLLGTVPSGPSAHASWPSSDESILVTTQEREDGKLRIFDISNPALPVLLSEMDRTSLGIDAISPHNPVLFNDDLLFVSWLEAGVVAIDISDPSDPQLLGNYDTYPGGAAFYDGNWGVYPFLGLDKVLLSDFEAGLVIVDASSLPEPSQFLQLVSGVGMVSLLAFARRRSRPSRGVHRETNGGVA